MKIVLLDGGLANQMTQYIFARCLQQATDEPVFLDDLYFYGSRTVEAQSILIENINLQLGKFPNIGKVPLMSEYFDRDVWLEIVRRSEELGPLDGGSWLPQILKENGLEFFMISEAPLYRFDGMVARMPYYHYIPEMLQSQGDAYYFGWFTHGGWFMSHEQMFRHELTLPHLTGAADLALAKEIAGSLSIGVHIRCSGGYKAQGIALQPAYYRGNIGLIREYLTSKRNTSGKQPHFFIFSDDIAWCRERADELGLTDLPYPVTFGQAEREPNDNHCDMALLSQCDIMLLNNSVYGYMAALLNGKPNKIVLNPVKNRGVF